MKNRLFEVKTLSVMEPKELNIPNKIKKEFSICKMDINRIPSYFLASEDTNGRLKVPKELDIEIQMMSFAPYDLSGYNICPKSTPECRKVCLGITKYGLTVKQEEHIKCKMLLSRVKRTILYKEHFEYFSNRLISELIDRIKKAKKRDKTIAIRLNGYSDVLWENVDFSVFYEDIRSKYYSIYKKEPKNSNIMSLFPDITFYDYTKYKYNERTSKDLPKNYHLTYSISESSGKEEIKNNLLNNRNVAVVVTKDLKERLLNEEEIATYQIIDGDEYDYRVYDETFKSNKKKGLIILLEAVSDATKIESNFIYNDLSDLF